MKLIFIFLLFSLFSPSLLRPSRSSSSCFRFFAHCRPQRLHSVFLPLGPSLLAGVSEVPQNAQVNKSCTYAVSARRRLGFFDCFESVADGFRDAMVPDVRWEAVGAISDASSGEESGDGGALSSAAALGCVCLRSGAAPSESAAARGAAGGKPIGASKERCGGCAVTRVG